MCEYCVTAHKRINAFLGHRILSLAEVKNLGSKALAKPALLLDVTAEEGLKAVKAMETRVEAKIARVSKDVDVFFDERVKALEEMRANLKLEVKTQSQAKLKALSNQEEMLALSLAQLRNRLILQKRR